jgi:hypothetical protein
MAVFTIFVDSKKLFILVTAAAARVHAQGRCVQRGDDPLGSTGVMNLRRHSPSGRVPVFQHAALTVQEPLAMSAPMTGSVAHAMPLGVKAQPWVIDYDVHAGAA